MPRPFTDPWATAFRDAVNADAEYRAAAANWTWPVALALDPTPTLGYPEPVAVELDLAAGSCTGARVLATASATAPIVLGADYATWKRVVRGELDPVTGVATGQLRLDRGSLMTLMLHTGAARALVATAQKVPTEFPDEGENGTG